MKSSGKIKILPDGGIFTQRENGKTHTDYEAEVRFYSCIEQGDEAKLRDVMSEMFGSDRIVAGKLSDNSLTQMKYWAVCCITLATRYAIRGGLDETDAFNFSDECILSVDRMSDESEIIDFLMNRSVELTRKVKGVCENRNYPNHIKKCMHCINTNLHSKLTVGRLADECGLSEDYLSALFKRTVGITVSEYIRTQRLKASKAVLLETGSVSQTAYYLGFCSESYFIKCFREEYGATPKKYIDSH